MDYLQFNSNTQTKESQDSVSPEAAIALLKEGNARFVGNNGATRNLHQQVNDTSTGQYPFAAVVSCIDSRIPTEIVFDQGIGDIFNARVAGNFVNPDILGSLEFACQLAGSKLIVILGHTSCGAVKGACDGAELGNLTQMLEKIHPAINATSSSEGEARDSSNLKFVNSVSEANVRHNVARTLDESPVLRSLKEEGKIDVVGAMYDVKTGKVAFL